MFLTECDPSRFSAGDFVEVEIVGARQYDFVARPVLDTAEIEATGTGLASARRFGRRIGLNRMATVI